ncbi:testis-expressed protein 36 [Tiliqua scincoides]|uniref:testis-expressed protein 36 n=1 Tax=Tiliqua scincoides TaxID=71010 RepID=UPI00346342EF
MPKGRRANPSTARDGAWFSQNRKQQLYPESLTATMQKQILNTDAVCQIDNRLPLMYKLREKFVSLSYACGYENCLAYWTNVKHWNKPVNTFPFSVHDNRHCLMNVGEYLDSGLGLRKFQQEMCQHYSQNILFLAHEPLPSSTGIRSIYQTSFIQYPNAENSLLARFPKNHVKRSIALKPADKNECMWFSKFYASHHNVVPVEPDRSSLPEPKQLLPAVQAAE